MNSKLTPVDAVNHLNSAYQIVNNSVEETLRMHEQGEPVNKILSHLVIASERIAGRGSVSSILLLDNKGLLRNGSSPGLPFDYIKAIDGIKPHPKLGTCASAAATGNVVVTLDFKADDKWAELRHLPMALGFMGAWSMPIKTMEGRVLGTFGTYYTELREPTEIELSSVKRLAEIAAMVVGD